MVDPVEFMLEAVNALIALLALYLGLQIIFAMRLTLQKRAMILFISAAVLFALQELLALGAELMLQSEDLGLIREIIETAFILCLVAGMYLVIRSEKNEISVLRQSAERDPLTKLYNLAYFRRTARRRIEQARKYVFPLTLAMLDIDDFKQYNDTYGHEAGNLALQALAEVFQETARSEDMLCRYGGEEFAILMVNSPEAAQIAAERIRLAIAAKCSPEQDPRLHRPLTVSIGLAALTPVMDGPEALIEAADRALYCAKKSGRNCIASAAC